VEEEILKRYGYSTITLIEGRGGVFEVCLNGKIIFSKHDQRRFPRPLEINDYIVTASGNKT